LTGSLWSSILNLVLLLCRRLSVLVLVSAVAAGQLGVCAGWMATPEARMACCSDSACPMHKAGSHATSSARALTQAEADRCCAASEQDDSARSTSNVVFAVSLGVVSSPVPVVLPDVALHPDSWRAAVPAPATRVPKHLLLSVLLV
jgi:hypothetical protein